MKLFIIKFRTLWKKGRQKEETNKQTKNEGKKERKTNKKKERKTRTFSSTVQQSKHQ